MKIICHKCKTTQDKGRYCVNADCYHPFRQGGWSTKISNELKDTIGINESTINNNQKNETVEKCSNCDKEKEPDSIYCSNCGEKYINNKKQCPLCLKVYYGEESYCTKDGALLNRNKNELRITGDESSILSNQDISSYKYDINIDKKTLEKNLSKTPFILTLIIYAIFLGYLKTNTNILSLGVIPGAIFGFFVTGTIGILYHYFRK